MIDWNKPLEDATGRPCVLIAESFGTERSPRVVRFADGNPQAGGNFFSEEGLRTDWGGEEGPTGQLRNVAPTFDPTKPVETRDGRKARIICTDRAHEQYPLLALLTASNGVENYASFAADGSFYAGMGESESDLVNVEPEKVEFYNVGTSYGMLKAAQRQHEGWPVLKVTRRGDKVLSTEVLPATAA